MEDKKVYERALKNWGKAPQLLQCVEEMAELTKEILKHVNRNKDNVAELIEETADVEIMLAQLKYCLNVEKEVADYKSQKLKKISTKLDEWEENL